MRDFYTINRYALILRPSRDMINWLNSVFPNDPVEFDTGEVHDKYDVFLIPEFESLEEAQNWLKENYLEFFEYVLEEWCGYEDVWPDLLNWELFERFIEYSLQTIVVDSVEEDYDEHFKSWELN